MEIVVVDLTDLSFHQFYEDKCLYDGIPRGSNGELSMVCFVENSKGIAKVVFDLSFGCNHYFILWCLFFILLSRSRRSWFSLTSSRSLGLGGSSGLIVLNRIGLSMIWLLFWGVGWFLDSVAHCIFLEIAAQTRLEIIPFKFLVVLWLIYTISNIQNAKKLIVFFN